MMKNKNDESLFKKDNELKETSDTLLEYNSNNSNATADTTDRKEDYMSLKIEKDNFLDNQNTKSDIEKNTFTTKNKIINTQRFGNTFPFFFKNGEPTIVIGPHWPFFLGLSGFITFMFYLFISSFWDKLSDILKFFGLLIYLIQMSSYSYTALINPGIPKNSMDIDGDVKDSLKNIRNYRICKVCNVIMNKDENTMHCDDCNTCIEGHDHHCPWTTKCVGKGNLKAFYFFVGFSFVLMGYVFVCLFSLQN